MPVSDDRQEAQHRSRRVDAEQVGRGSPIWKIAVMPPKAASSDSTNPSVAVSGTRIERNTSTRMSSGEPDDQREVGRQHVGELLGDVDVAAGVAGHAEGGLAAVGRRRGELAQVADELLRSTRWTVTRPGRPGRPAPSGPATRRSARPRRRRQTPAEPLADGGLLGEHVVLGRPRPGRSATTSSGPLDAVAELLRLHLVGLVAGASPAAGWSRPGRPRRIWQSPGAAIDEQGGDAEPEDGQHARGRCSSAGRAR